MKEWKNRYNVGVFVYRDKEQIGVTAPYIRWVSFYVGYSKTAANAACFKACEYAANEPLAECVMVDKDNEIVFNLKIAH
jgi:hypothetical protein